MSKLFVDEIASKTGATDALTIDTAGRISMPNQPVFSVSGSNNNYVQTTPIPFGTLEIDNASGFSATTYTVPKAGKYNFTINLGLVRLSANELMTIYLHKNGASVGYCYADTNGGSGYTYLPMTFVKIIDCAVGDTFNVIAAPAGTSSTYYNGTAECRFSGHLIG